MATIPTQNAVPSEAPRDLKFNSGKIDEFVTSLEREYKDRFGRCHMTIEGMRWIFEQLMERFKVDINQAIIAAGYIPMDSFQQGAEITKRNEILRDETTGEYYRWDGDLPKYVPVGSTPESAGGIGMGAWVSVGDASLRGELSKPTGAGLVGTESGKTVQESLSNVSEVVEGNTINSNEYKVLNNDLFSPFGHMGILVTGQSLAEGGVGNNVFPPVMSCMNYCAKTLSLGPIMYSDNTIGSDIIGVKEPIRASVSTTLTDGLITRCIADNAYISGQAWGGKKYVDIKKNGNTDLYNKCLAQATRFKALRPSINYGAVVVIHGEADGYVNNTNYAENIIEWQKDFNADISSITGQKNKIPMFLCQTATAGGYGWNGGINDMNFQSPIQQLIAHESKGDVFMVCSKYHLKYADHAHITNESQAVLGEYYAKAMDSYYSTGSWEPCRPVSIIQSGTSITIKFTGVEDGLVFDVSAVKPAENKGFAFSDDSGAEIIDVAISGKDSVVISLSKTPTTSKVLAYAYHNGAGGSANQVSGLGDRGNLRGTSKQTSKTTGLNLHNWCVIFRKEF
ncbi:sialate O-acetylesterase [Morganella morganii]|uniref:tail fiber/spike domain-containing protein n=1 Tax=Morganella morganii TaxID=582 RepID=UPI000BBD3594|nr:sialate O-acetylesterase [Morganella morganii]ATF52657.1 hypothetical protein CO693_02550 [Morganella morganii]